MGSDAKTGYGDNNILKSSWNEAKTNRNKRTGETTNSDGAPIFPVDNGHANFPYSEHHNARIELPGRNSIENGDNRRPDEIILHRAKRMIDMDQIMSDMGVRDPQEGNEESLDKKYSSSSSIAVAAAGLSTLKILPDEHLVSDFLIRDVTKR